MLPSINTFFKIERDPFYIMGFEKGLKIGLRKANNTMEYSEARLSYRFVTNLINKFDFSDNQIADVVNVPVAFVKKVRKSLKKAGK